MSGLPRKSWIKWIPKNWNRRLLTLENVCSNADLISSSTLSTTCLTSSNKSINVWSWELLLELWTLSTFITGWNTTTYTDNYYSFSQCGQCRIQNHWWCSGAGAGEGEGEGGIMASFRLLEHLKIGQNIFFCHFNLIFLLFTCFYLWNTGLKTEISKSVLRFWSPHPLPHPHP